MEPYREPIGSVVLRNIVIAVVVGVSVALIMGRLSRWPALAVLALWPTFGGHWLEVFYLNWLRPRLPATRRVQIAARIGVWFAGGMVFAAAVRVTAIALASFPAMTSLSWWIGGLGFIGVELVAHFGLMLRGRANFYDGRG